MTGPSIRDATPADIGDLQSLLADLFAQEAEFSPDAERQRRGLAAILGTPDFGRVLLAEMDGEVAGMVVLLYTISTALGGRVALLEDMVVAGNRRGTGIGRALLAAAVAAAREDGCLRITLLTDPENAPAHRFYAAAGFVRSPMTPYRLTLA